MSKRGFALIMSFLVILVLAILAVGMLLRTISERTLTQRYVDSTKAFWMAEAGVNRALNELRNNYNSNGTGIWNASLSGGRYSIDVSDVISGGQPYKRVTAYGFYPALGASIERIVEARMSKFIPPNFFDHAIYSAGEVDLNGAAYSITGDVRYADTLDNPQNINGVVTHDASISPLARLDFQQLRSISQSQGNVYDSQRLKDVKQGNDSFPNSFWYIPPSDPNDPASGTPNVVYVESDLALNGSIGTIGGFFAVVGDVLTNPAQTQDASINGNGQIEGAIYTLGEFDVNGGGGGLNVNGGVWAGKEAELNGNAHIAYNQDYMLALQSLGIVGSVQVTSWEDKQNPYPLTP